MKLSLISTHDKASDIAHINVFCNLHLELKEKMYFSWRLVKLKIFFFPIQGYSKEDLQQTSEMISNESNH